MAVLASDDFNRANSATLGANWTTLGTASSMGVGGNQAENSTSAQRNANYYSAITWPDDHYVQSTFVALGSRTNMVLARNTPGASRNFYGAGQDFNNHGGATTTARLVKHVNNTPTSLGATVLSLAAGDTVRIEAQGTTIRMLVNSSTIHSVTDSAHSSGSAGIYGDDGSSGTNLQDNWEGGDFSSASAPRLTLLGAGK